MECLFPGIDPHPGQFLNIIATFLF
jgi:hypothetical protein